MKRVIVLASGGVDSSVLVVRAHRAGELVGLVWCNYGQPAALQEWRALEALRARLGLTVPVHEVPLTTIYAQAMQTPSGAPGPRVVPHRNLLMLAHALNWAESIGATHVWYGAIYDDRANYADCRPRFVFDLNHAMSAAEGGRFDAVPHAVVDAPLMGLTKAQVMAEAETLGLLDLAWSCYAPDRNQPCGTCDSCRVRDGARVPA